MIIDFESSFFGEIIRPAKIRNCFKRSRFVLFCKKKHGVETTKAEADLICHIVKMIGMNDRFGKSGKPWELMKLFGLTAEFIAKACWEAYRG